MLSLPQQFEESIRRQLDTEYADFFNSLQSPPPVSIRLHAVKRNIIGVEGSVPWSAFGRYLPIRPIFTLDPLFHAGSYYVQEASSMFLEQALKQTVDLRQPVRILDLCAAPGGKSTHILNLINRDSLLVSNETIRSRAAVLSENIQKAGYPNAVVTSNDPADFGKLRGFFDAIVVDAPCSGEGLFRKEPEAMKEWSPANVQLCASRQKRIIADVWGALREDGIFIYCTCTYNPFENEENLKWLEENHGVEFLELATQPDWGVEEVHEGRITGYRFFPHKVRGEGFFLAVIRKKETVNSPGMKVKKSLATPAAKIEETLRRWILDSNANKLFQFNDLVFYMPSSVTADLAYLLPSLKIVYAGTNLATVKHDKLIPEHALALSVELNHNNVAICDVTESDALTYLKKETISLPGAAKGFSLLAFHEQGIGWVNVLANRVNNLYPKEWRIRMALPGTPRRSTE